jgi:ubiquinone biosynthesis protein COQ9
MDNDSFDHALMTAAFALAGEEGWHRLSIAAAARRAGLPLDRARRRFPGRVALLVRLGRAADAAALADMPAEGSVRDRLFHLLMRRLDILGAHRGGVLALLRALPFDPPLALFLAAATRRSMGWMLEAAGVPATGPRGMLRVKGLVAVWLWTLRAWRTDESDDLSATMAALDTALARAERAASWLAGAGPAETPAREAPERHATRD